MQFFGQVFSPMNGGYCHILLLMTVNTLHIGWTRRDSRANAARSPSDVTASETIQTAAGGPLKSAKGFDPPARSEVSRSLVAVAEDHQCRVSVITRYVKRKDFFLLHPRTPLLRNLITAQPFPFCFHATISARPCLCRLQ